MSPWQNERWACAPTNDGRNFAPAHRWAVVEARPLCFGLLRSRYGVQVVSSEPCWCGKCAHVIACIEAGDEVEDASADYAALARSYIREAHDLWVESQKLRDDWSTFTEQDYADAYNDGFEACYDKLKDAEADNNALRDRVATLEAENSRLRASGMEAMRRAEENVPRCPDCGHRLDTEECGCGGDA